MRITEISEQNLKAAEQTTVTGNERSEQAFQLQKSMYNFKI